MFVLGYDLDKKETLFVDVVEFSSFSLMFRDTWHFSYTCRLLLGTFASMESHLDNAFLELDECCENYIGTMGKFDHA